MSELFNSLAEAIKFRATTALIGTYFSFWAILHWEAIYTTLFVSETEISEKFGMLKNEYINIYFIQPQPENPSYWVSIFLPAAATFLWIWVLPRFLFLHAFNKERDYKFEKRSRIIRDRLDLQKLENRRAKQSEEAADSNLKAAQKELEATRRELEVAKINAEAQKVRSLAHANEDSKEKRYDGFMKRPDARRVLHDIKECIYGHNGWIAPGGSYRLNSDSLAVAHTHELVKLNKNIIELTDLGKFFLSKQ